MRRSACLGAMLAATCTALIFAALADGTELGEKDLASARGLDGVRVKDRTVNCDINNLPNPNPDGIVTSDACSTTKNDGTGTYVNEGKTCIDCDVIGQSITLKAVQPPGTPTPGYTNQTQQINCGNKEEGVCRNGSCSITVTTPNGCANKLTFHQVQPTTVDPTDP